MQIELGFSKVTTKNKYLIKTQIDRFSQSKVYFFRNALAPFTTNSTIQSYHGLTTIGTSGGIGYAPAICGTMKYRTAVTQNGNGGYPDQTVAEVIAITYFEYSSCKSLF